MERGPTRPADPSPSRLSPTWDSWALMVSPMSLAMEPVERSCPGRSEWRVEERR